MRYRYRDESEMKESGVEWVGKIPKDWEVVRGKFLFENNKIKNRGLMDNVLSLTLNGVIDRDINKFEGLQPENFDGYQEFRKDNLVFKLIDLENISTSRVGLVHRDGLMSPAYIRLENKVDMDTRYYYYNYFDYYKKNIFNFLGSVGVRSALNSSDLLEMEILNIDKKEQEIIANFLDENMYQFDLIISKKEDLIERLEEAKKSLISEVVTGKVKIRKFDDRYELVKRERIKMKDSGVEWIGEIPNNFKTVRLGLISFVTKLAGFEYTNNMASAISSNGDVPIVRAGNIKMNKFIDQEKEFIDLETSELLNRCALNKKCVLITFIGAGIGEVALFDKVKRYHLAPNVAKIEILGENKKKIDEQYLIYYLMSSAGQEEVNKIKKASAQPSLSMETIRSMKIVLPELKEQLEINKYLTSKIKEVDDIICKMKFQIMKLKEAKQSLISEVVTGKIEILD